MSFIRWVFLLALVMLIAGIFIGQRLLGPMFTARSLGGPGNIAAIVTTTTRSTRTPAPKPTVMDRALPPTSKPALIPTTVAPSPTAITAPSATIAPAPTPGLAPHHPIGHRRSRLRSQYPRPTSTALPTAAPLPTSTALSGVVALERYWIGTPSARAGTVISVGYVIDNGTGHTARIMLGASLKSSQTVGWIASIADPSHDVVAAVLPGVSTHIRYFTLPSHLRAGAYDIAWGLRNALNGRRDALVFASAALYVAR